MKINVTNAYAGSLAWSNFFARLTHSHPGRVVWLVFNVLIAVMLMELGVFEALEHVLGLYSNVAIAWVGALVADLVDQQAARAVAARIEFKRAHLYDINPVGRGRDADRLGAVDRGVRRRCSGAHGAGLLAVHRAGRPRCVAAPLHRLVHARALLHRAQRRRALGSRARPCTLLRSATTRSSARTWRTARPTGADLLAVLHAGARCHDRCKTDARAVGAGACRRCARCCRARLRSRHATSRVGHYLRGAVSLMRCCWPRSSALVYYQETAVLSGRRQRAAAARRAS